MPARDKSNEIHITRVYDAPVKAVWEAWTDINQVVQWWGPRGFTLTSHSKSLKPGGIWHYTMHGPDGVDYPNKTLYHEVEEYRKLVYDHGGYDDRPPLFRVTALFSESDGKTTLEFRMSLPTAEQAEATRQFIKKAGGDATWDRLAEYLNKTEHGRNSFVINRSFAAPISLMFEMWTDPAHFAKWLPPVGFDMQLREGDIREGASCFFQMSNGAGVSIHGKIEYREIRKPGRLVYVQRFCDEAGNIARHPGAPEFPAALQTTVLLTAEGPDATRVTVTMEPFGQTTPQEIDAFMNERPGMTLGWTGSFDKLESELTNIEESA